jgi:hypothetical protein
MCPASGGAFGTALYSHFQQNVTSVFAAVISALSSNDNMTILIAAWDSVQLRDWWPGTVMEGVCAVVLNPA